MRQNTTDVSHLQQNTNRSLGEFCQIVVFSYRSMFISLHAEKSGCFQISRERNTFSFKNYWFINSFQSFSHDLTFLNHQRELFFSYVWHFCNEKHKNVNKNVASCEHQIKSFHDSWSSCKFLCPQGIHLPTNKQLGLRSPQPQAVLELYRSHLCAIYFTVFIVSMFTTKVFRHEKQCEDRCFTLFVVLHTEG